MTKVEADNLVAQFAAGYKGKFDHDGAVRVVLRNPYLKSVLCSQLESRKLRARIQANMKELERTRPEYERLQQAAIRRMRGGLV